MYVLAAQTSARKPASVAVACYAPVLFHSPGSAAWFGEFAVAWSGHQIRNLRVQRTCQYSWRTFRSWQMLQGSCIVTGGGAIVVAMYCVSTGAFVAGRASALLIDTGALQTLCHLHAPPNQHWWLVYAPNSTSCLTLACGGRGVGHLFAAKLSWH